MQRASDWRRLFWAVAVSVVFNAAWLGLVGWLWAARTGPPAQEPLRVVRVAVWKPAPVEPPAVAVKPQAVKRPVVKPPPVKRVVTPPKPRPVVRPKVVPRRATLAAPSRRPRKSNPKPGPSGGSSGGGTPSLATAPNPAPTPSPVPSPTPQLAHSDPNGRAVMPALPPGNAPLAEPALPSSPPAGGGEGASGGTGAGGGHGGQGDGGDSGNGAGRGSGGGPFGMGTGSGEGPRHIVYVLDISGSMASRIDRARQELRESLAGLQPGESFNIITFSDTVHAFDDGLDPATPGMLRRANYFLGTLQVEGGTNLDDALARALTTPGVNVVFVMTDGVPTQGETSFRKIARNARALNSNGARIYTVGLVGKNPDGTDDSFKASDLLRQIARESGGVSRMVPLGVAMP